MNKLSITSTTKKELQNELDNLLKVERPKVIQEISEAREQGDLSENAEFDAAREKQAHLEARIQEIQAILENHKLIRETHNGKARKVNLGTTVDLENLKTKKIETYSIIGSVGVNPFAKPMKISNDSPLGRAIMHKVVGDEITIKEVRKPYKVVIKKIR